LYYMSLMAALTIPDICAALDSPDGQTTGERYKEWFRKHLGATYGESFTAEDCYYFRCSLLHQGTTEHPNSKYKKIICVEPTTNGSILHRNVLNDVFNIDVRIFCLDLAGAATQWLAQVENTELYKANADKFIRRYPAGLPPYIVGVPVIG